MKKLYLTAVAAICAIQGSNAQTDTATYKKRKLKIDEINFVSGYYMQDGNNSAVTGGIGTEKLTDFANTLELRLVKPGRNGHTHNWAVEMGIDHYSSASSNKIDPSTLSSASYADTRFYPTISYANSNARSGFTYGAVASYSQEFDYHSRGLGLNLAKASASHNTEVSLKLQAYWDTWTLIYPIELRPSPDVYSGHDNKTSPRNSYSASLSIAQVVNQRLQLAFLADGVYQQGLLATRYQRVYFTNGGERIENLPDQRTKIPLGMRLSWFATDRFLVRSFYRYYTDNWGISAHTASLEVPVKITPFISATPFYRYYTQTAANYFAPYQQHAAADEFYTSDYDLSAFQSHFYGAGIRLTPERGVFGLAHFTMLELRYGHYTRGTGLTSDIISLNARFR